MSYETLTMGKIKFKNSSDYMIRSLVLIAIEKEIEGATKYNRNWDEWTFEKINLCSHVRAERIEEIIKEHKDDIESFSCSIFNLESPDERVILDNGEIISQIIRRP